MDPLCYDSLSIEEKINLGSMTHHPGFSILKKLLEDACLKMTQKVIKIKPEDSEYDRKVKAFQLEAHVVNEFCATLLKSIYMHVEVGDKQSQMEKLQKEAEEESSNRFGIGSIVRRVSANEAK